MKRILALSFALILGFISTFVGAEPRTITNLLRALDSKETQSEALWELEDWGLDAAPAVPQLVKLLDVHEGDGRKAAVRILQNVGKDATPAIPKLVELLGEGEASRFFTTQFDMGTHASFALGAIGKDAVPFLVPCLTNKNSSVRSLAASALHSIGSDAHDAVKPLIELLKDEDWFVRQCAVEALGGIRSELDLTILALIERLQDENFNVRRSAAAALGDIQPTTRATVEALTRALDDKEGYVRHEAALALGKLGDNSVIAVPVLAKLLNARESYGESHPTVLRPVAKTAACALGAIGPDAKAALPALLECVADTTRTFDEFRGSPQDNYEARGEAAIAAARIDPQSDELFRVLSKSLEEDDSIRGKVAIALALIGPKAKGTIPSLMRHTQSESRYALNCACAVVVIEPSNPQAMEAMLRLMPPNNFPLDEADWALFWDALKQGGAPSRRAIPKLIRLVKDPARDKKNAARALEVFGPQAESAIPALLELLFHHYEYPRQPAIVALRQICSEKSATLVAALQSPNANVRSGVVEVLGHHPDALPLIVKALDDPSARVQLAALHSLAKLGAIAKPAVPQIRKLLQSDLRTIREAASTSLELIEQDKSAK